MKRDRELGHEALHVNEIYEYNIGSRKRFESAGLRVCEKTANADRFVLEL